MESAQSICKEQENLIEEVQKRITQLSNTYSENKKLVQNLNAKIDIFLRNKKIARKNVEISRKIQETEKEEQENDEMFRNYIKEYLF